MARHAWRRVRDAMRRAETRLHNFSLALRGVTIGAPIPPAIAFGFDPKPRPSGAPETSCARPSIAERPALPLNGDLL
jgi:hypothetical protein